MKTLNKLLSVTVISLLATCSFSWAAADGSSNGVNHGKPFQELYQEISENRALIEDNQGAISDLRAEVASINADISAVQDDIDELNTQVASNTDGLSEAFARIAAAEGDISSLYDDLSALAARHDADMSALQADIAAIEADINDLSQQSSDLSALLAQRVAELRTLIGDNALAIDGLLADVVLINAELTAINGRHNNLVTLHNSLQSQVNNYGTLISNLDASLEELKGRVNDHFDCVERIASVATINGELRKDTGCLSDSRYSSSGYEYAARYYTFTLSATKTVTIDMEGSSTGAGTLYDPYLYLHSGGRTGAVITYNDDGGTGWNARIVRNLGAGTYTIEATAFSSYQVGTFRLTVH